EVVMGDVGDRGAHVARPIEVVEPAPRGKHQKPADTRPPKRAKEKTPESSPIEEPVKPKPVEVTLDLTNSDYTLPPLSLLDGGTGGEINKRSLEETARQLEDTLLQHGVDAQLTKI